MIQCDTCEYFSRTPGGRVLMTCDPYSTIKEPECLVKRQLLALEQLNATYGSTLSMYRKFAPLQEKMFKFMEREIDEMNEGDKWKTDDGLYDPPEDDDPLL